ncbi:MAG: hypothetical protein M4579_002084 [Chaenotheca gracillima]|nr:MAG: hypothetical protein M4579_002084 [Chaenotheca gracillima]
MATASPHPAPPSITPTFPLTFPSTTSTTQTNPPTLISHGAEAHLYLTHHLLAHPSRLCVLKHRPRKPYRHPTLDARLTRHRILSEARVLAKLRRDSACAPSEDDAVDVPALWAADWEAGWLMMEYVRGGTVRERLGSWKAARGGPRDRSGAEGDVGDTDVTVNGWAPHEEAATEVRTLLWRVGQAVGRLHKAGVVHGDLTTGNMLIRDAEAEGDLEPGDVSASLDGPITLIDFGLAAQVVQEEDRAVDLYVLERALGSSHPGLEEWFDPVLMLGYAAGLGGGDGRGGKHGPKVEGESPGMSSPQVKAVRRKLDEVRKRGRKRSMLG